MKYRGTMTRMQANELPSTPCVCDIRRYCVYRVDGICEDPRIYKGNGDAACHLMGNRAIYEMLHEILEQENDVQAAAGGLTQTAVE